MRRTSVVIRKSFLALTSNWITFLSSSAGGETQQSLCSQLPAEEICHIAASINLCHILSVGLNSLGSVQLSWSLSNPATSGEAKGHRVSGRAICYTEGGLCPTPPFLSSLVYWPFWFSFVQRQSCPVASDLDGYSQVLITRTMPLNYMDQHLQG